MFPVLFVSFVFIYSTLLSLPVPLNHFQIKTVWIKNLTERVSRSVNPPEPVPDINDLFHLSFKCLIEGLMNISYCMKQIETLQQKQQREIQDKPVVTMTKSTLDCPTVADTDNGNASATLDDLNI